MKIATFILIVCVAVGAFYAGARFYPINQGGNITPVPTKIESPPKVTDDVVSNRLNFECTGERKFSLEYMQIDHSPGPGAVYIPETRTSVNLQLESQEIALLNQPSFSDSFSSFISADKSTVLQIKNELASIVQNGKVMYEKCSVK
ncbi:MAG TPA: hypothetical protein VI981_02885 [Candidatus Paceibacterota bacterium]